MPPRARRCRGDLTARQDGAGDTGEHAYDSYIAQSMVMANAASTPLRMKNYDVLKKVPPPSRDDLAQGASGRCRPSSTFSPAWLVAPGGIPVPHHIMLAY